MMRRASILGLGFIAGVLLLAGTAAAAPAGAGNGHAPFEVPALWVIPFALMLLSIAVLPLVKEHWWEDNNHKLLISVVLSIPVLVYLGIVRGGEGGLVKLEHSIVEYFQFIALLGSLYIISGGIVVRGALRPTPLTNVTILTIGTMLASFIGTTGASMLLIRPLLRANGGRRFRVHTVVFFIFCVSNIGGLLTPLGDPPLFLGYLRGVPFTWTFSLWPAWVGMNGVLLLMYLLIDMSLLRREGGLPPVDPGEPRQPLSVAGTLNFLLLLGIVLCVAQVPSIVTDEHRYIPYREICMGILVIASLKLTPRPLREENQFNYHAIIEVAYLFIGIFITMTPALAIIAYMAGHNQLPIEQPWHFFWITGGLSSFLDNAPTYVTFFEAAKGLSVGLPDLVAGVREDFLVAISTGAVFMGANTYIGNGPNFMVKAIADSQGVRMPSFFGYMAYSIGILFPLFVLFTILMNGFDWQF